MPRTIAITNRKGGVGKTTTAVNLSACLAAMQFRTLLVDLDPQGNASSGVGIDTSTLTRSVYDVLIGQEPAEAAIVPTGVENLSVLPARPELVGAEVELVDVEGRERLLREALASVADRFDYILIDCPPSLGLLTLNALVAADGCIVPVQTEYYALEGLASLLETVELVRDQLHPALRVEGVLLTLHDTRNNLSRQVESEVREHFGELTFTTVIPRNVRLSEAPSFGTPILMYDVESKGARSYLDLAREFLERESAADADDDALL